MWRALRRLGTRDIGRLPVVEREGSTGLVGVVRRSDIVRAYNHAIVKRAHHQHRVETLRLGKLVVSVRRGRNLHVAHGYTVLQAGDQLTVFADNASLPLVRECLESPLREQGQPERGDGFENDSY